MDSDKRVKSFIVIQFLVMFLLPITIYNQYAQDGLKLNWLGYGIVGFVILESLFVLFRCKLWVFVKASPTGEKVGGRFLLILLFMTLLGSIGILLNQ